MRRCRFVSLFGWLTLAALLAGCGGGARSTDPAGTGRAVLTVVWPARSRLIPLASNSIQATFSKAGVVIASQVIPRPATGNTATATFDDLKVGSLVLSATAYPNADGTGVAQAAGTVAVAINDGQTANVTLTMASTIDHLEISPPSPLVNVGGTTQLAVAAKNSAGQVVLVTPSKLTWTSSDTSIATVDATGKVTGVKVGSAPIMVKDTESGKVGVASLTVLTAGAELLVSSFGNNLIKVFDAVTGAFKGDLIDTAGSGLTGPHDIAIGPDGNLYVAGGQSSNVNRYNPTSGALIDAFIPAGSGGLSNATALLFMADGSLLAGSAGTSDVKHYRGTDGGYLGSFAGGNGLDTPAAAVRGPDGNMYVSSSGAASGKSEIKRFDGATGAFIDTFVADGSGDLSQPAGLAFGPNGNLYVCSTGTNSIKRYSGTSGAYLNDIVPAGSGGLAAPYSVKFGADGCLYVGCGTIHAVKRYSGSTGAYLGDFVPPGSGGLNGPTFLLFRPGP